MPQFETIRFGRYLFEEDGTMAPIEWNVIAERETPAGKQKLLWSKYILDAAQFDESLFSPEYNGSGCYSSWWARSTLREWLNCAFYNIAFTKEELRICI